MGLISAAVAQLACVPETTWGVTPATPAFQILRFLPPESFNISRENIVSGEHRADRNVTDLIQVGGGADGGFGFELSYGTYDAILESVLHGAWDTNVLKNGATPKTFTFERKIPTGESAAEYLRFLGMQANTMSLTCQAKQIVTGDFTFMGKGGAAASAAITGATYSDESTTDVMNAAADFASLTIGDLTNPLVLGLTLNINNNLRAPSKLGSVQAIGIGYGRFEVTGSMDVYFEDSSVLQKYLAGTALSLSFTIGGTTGKKYTIAVPKLKLETSGNPIGGNDEDLMLNLTWRGLYDATNECTLMITRAVA